VKLIVGLGNPGRIYIDSRHNIGTSCIKALAKLYKIHLKKNNHTFSLSGEGKIAGKSVILAAPLTFMNLSGLAVRGLLKKYKIDLDDLLIVCDDLDLEFGRIKIRPAGSPGGHRGLKSIIDSIEKQDFCRLRIGIGKPQDNMDAASFVLSAFNSWERAEVKDIIKKAVDCCRVWVTKGITESMNIFNKRSLKENE
jgi:PTH1 family peptidyl-tRNA hydrolase